VKIFCVTGILGADLDMVVNILASAGVKPPNSLPRHEALTFPEWHKQVLAAALEASSDPSAVLQPGKFWEQVASNLFLENIRTPIWGWADTRSVWLLDFWQQFEPNLHFLLVYTSPQRALATAMSSGLEQSQDIAALMANWQAHHQEMLRFHNRNPHRTMLIDADECCAAPAAVIAACARKWNLNFETSTIAAPSTTQPSALVRYLAEQLRQTQPFVQSLQHEIEASLQSLVAVAPQSALPGTDLNLIDAAREYRSLRNAAGEALTLANQCTQLTAQLERLVADNVQLKMRETKARDETDALQATNINLQKANELYLAQLSKAREEHAAATAVLKSELMTVEQRVADLNTEHALASTAASQELATAKRRWASLDNTVRDQTDKLNSSNQELELAKETCAEAQQESELVLIQLHQVQGELEHYFLQDQATGRLNQQLTERWQRMLKRNPDYVDCHGVEVLRVDMDKHRVSWRLSELNAGGRSFPELRFDTVIEQGMAGFLLTRGDKTEGACSLLRWPLCYASQSEALIGLEPANCAPGTAAALLHELSTSDLTLMQALCRLLIAELNYASAAVGLALLDVQERSRLVDALSNLLLTLTQAPRALRFDNLTLKRAQVNPDYEHLWLRLENLSLGEERWPEFEFRISCANVRPNKFGAYPKLEFPAAPVSQPLNSWFIESCDDFGEKLELRFALPESMDMNIWQALSLHDHAVLKSLIASIPAMLALIEQGGSKLARPWADWQDLATNVQQVLGARTGHEQSPMQVVNDATSLSREHMRADGEHNQANASASTSAKPSNGKKPQSLQQAG
jgi:hypothetical protein